MLEHQYPPPEREERGHMAESLGAWVPLMLTRGYKRGFRPNNGTRARHRGTGGSHALKLMGDNLKSNRDKFLTTVEEVYCMMPCANSLAVFEIQLIFVDINDHKCDCLDQ